MLPVVHFQASISSMASAATNCLCATGPCSNSTRRPNRGLRARPQSRVLNGVRLFQWDDDPARLSLSNQWHLNDSRYLGLGAHRTAYHISHYELLPIDSPKPPKLVAGEVLVRLRDGTCLPVKIDAEQALIVPTIGAVRKVRCDAHGDSARAGP